MYETPGLFIHLMDLLHTSLFFFFISTQNTLIFRRWERLGLNSRRTPTSLPLSRLCQHIRAYHIKEILSRTEFEVEVARWGVYSNFN